MRSDHNAFREMVAVVANISFDIMMWWVISFQIWMLMIALQNIFLEP
jgi:hypothetical protein